MAPLIKETKGRKARRANKLSLRTYQGDPGDSQNGFDQETVGSHRLINVSRELLPMMLFFKKGQIGVLVRTLRLMEKTRQLTQTEADALIITSVYEHVDGTTGYPEERASIEYNDRLAVAAGYLNAWDVTEAASNHEDPDIADAEDLVPGMYNDEWADLHWKGSRAYGARILRECGEDGLSAIFAADLTCSVRNLAWTTRDQVCNEPGMFTVEGSGSEGWYGKAPAQPNRTELRLIPIGFPRQEAESV